MKPLGKYVKFSGASVLLSLSLFKRSPAGCVFALKAKTNQTSATKHQPTLSRNAAVPHSS